MQAAPRTSYIAGVVGQALGTYLGSSGTRVQCLCEGRIEPALLDLVRAQLDRCGPKHMHGAPRAECAVPSCTGLVVLDGALWALLLVAVLLQSLAAAEWLRKAFSRGTEAVAEDPHLLRRDGGPQARTPPHGTGRLIMLGRDNAYAWHVPRRARGDPISRWPLADP